VRNFAILFLFTVATAVAPIWAQQTEPSKTPQVRVNYLNVCTPSADEQKELRLVLDRIPRDPHFGVDMEVSRGISTLSNSDLLATGGVVKVPGPHPVSQWVRIRHEFPDGSPVENSQYSFSVAQGQVSETLVFHFRDEKNVMQVSLSESVDAASNPAQVAALDTPAARIRIERFGKPSIVLARCPSVNQAIYEPLFRMASDRFSTYRHALGVKNTIPAELSRLPRIGDTKSSAHGKDDAPEGARR